MMDKNILFCQYYISEIENVLYGAETGLTKINETLKKIKDICLTMVEYSEEEATKLKSQEIIKMIEELYPKQKI